MRPQISWSDIRDIGSRYGIDVTTKPSSYYCFVMEVIQKEHKHHRWERAIDWVLPFISGAYLYSLVAPYIIGIG